MHKTPLINHDISTRFTYMKEHQSGVNRIGEIHALYPYVGIRWYFLFVDNTHIIISRHAEGPRWEILKHYVHLSVFCTVKWFFLLMGCCF